MPVLEWNDDLYLHLAEIDRQHLRLVKIINDLHEAMLAGQSREKLGPLIAALSDHAATHFAFEESYFREFGYGEAAAHEQAHETFRAKVSELEAGFAQGRPASAMHVLDFLTDWLIVHVQGEDRKYLALFKEKGLQ